MNRKTIFSLTLAIIVISALIVLLTSEKNYNQNNITNRNSSIEWTAYNSQNLGITMNIPSTWSPLVTESPLARTLDFVSQEKTDYIDPISNQRITEPIIKVSVREKQNPNRLSLEEWITTNTKDEVIRSQTKVTSDQWAGQRIWIVYERNAYPASLISYFILKREDTVLELAAYIDNDQPDSTVFREAAAQVDASFKSLTYTR